MSLFQPKKKVKQIAEVSAEKLKKSTVETVKQTYTLLSRDIISQLTGKEPETNTKNFTPFNDEIRKKMGANFESQDSGDLAKVREQLAEHNQTDALKKQLEQRRFEQVKQEEKQAYEQIKAEEEQRKRQEAE